MKVNIIAYQLPGTTPTPKNECGWIALYDGEPVGWVKLIFLSDKTLKFSSAFVVEKYRGKGIYSQLWNARMEYCKENFKGYDVIAYCLPDSTHFYEKKGWEIGGLTTLMKSKID
jgi:predicted GNAT family acetyltransferase|tara:strand:- start:258 stop:599 length:342 start_codon:yes stop_codon:yes gene_type:complete